MKMSTAFELPVNRTTIDWAVKYNDDRARSYAAHAINQHDRLVEALENMIPLAAAHAFHDEDWEMVDAALAVLNSEVIE